MVTVSGQEYPGMLLSHLPINSDLKPVQEKSKEKIKSDSLNDAFHNLLATISLIRHKSLEEEKVF